MPSPSSADASSDAPSTTELPPTLTLGKLFRLWFPLALSFELMMLEGPSLQAAVSRLPNAEVHLAAWGLTISLSLLVESPVIMLLSTSIALCRDRPAYEALRRFTTRLCAGCTAVAALLAFTPLYALVTEHIMGQPEGVRNAARPALQLMLLWSAGIGWRRFLQGVQVRAGRTTLMSWGTLVRLLAVLTAATALVHQGTLSGVAVAAVAVMAGVLAEAATASVLTPPIVARLDATCIPGAELTQASILRYHLPLAATTLLNLLAMPIQAAGLARMPDPAATLAAWPVMFGALLVLRGWGMALQEIAVANLGQAGALPILRRLTWLVGGATSLATLALVHTALFPLYLGRALHVPEALHPHVALGLTLCSLQPLITAWASLHRGTLLSRGASAHIYWATTLSLLAQVALLGLAIYLGWPGVWGASAAFMGSTLLELAWLGWNVRRALRTR